MRAAIKYTQYFILMLKLPDRLFSIKFSESHALRAMIMPQRPVRLDMKLSQPNILNYQLNCKRAMFVIPSGKL